MKKSIAAAAAVLSLAVLATPSMAGSGGVKIGVLNCHVQGGAGFIIGSSKDVDCVFKPANGGKREYYSGSIGKLGVDLGVTNDTVLGWAVFAPGHVSRGALKGSYTGAGAEATIGGGLGANVLIGGFKKGINLQPISLQAQTGLNVAAGVASLHLKYDR